MGRDVAQAQLRQLRVLHYITRIIEVERNPEYAYHQAWVRRKGSMEAKHCRILTTDIDLIINRTSLKR